MSTWQAELAQLVPAELLGAEDNARIPPLQYAVQVGEYSHYPPLRQRRYSQPACLCAWLCVRGHLYAHAVCTRATVHL